MPRTPTNRPAKVARRQHRRERDKKNPRPPKQKPEKKTRPWPRTKGWPKPGALAVKKTGPFRRKLAALAITGASCLGAAGCAPANRNYAVRGMNSLDIAARRASGKEAGKLAGETIGSFVPVVGGVIGGKIVGKAADIVFGPDMLKEIEKIPRDKRFTYVMGMPVVKDPWFKPLGLDPSNETHKPLIDVAEMLSGQTKLLPEEIVLVAGAYPRAEWPYRLMALKQTIPRLNSQIQGIEESLTPTLHRIRPKLDQKKQEAALKKLRDLQARKDRLAMEFVAIKAMQNLGNDPRLSGLLQAIYQNLSLQGCRQALDVLY